MLMQYFPEPSDKLELVSMVYCFMHFIVLSFCLFVFCQVFNDPIHGSIELHPLLIKIIDTPQFQRLRFIKQLGGVYFVYPGASHNRFEHSIGVGYLAGKLAEALRSRQTELKIDDRDVLCVQIAGLCHDLGHGPFSHLYDGLFLPKALEKKKEEMRKNGKFREMEKLEKLEKWKIRNLMRQYGLTREEDITFIKEMIAGPLQESEGKKWPYKRRPEENSFLYEIVSNKKNGVDVDKFDYLARDSSYLGIKNNFDFHRFLQFARVCEVDGRKTICTRDKEEDHMYDLFYTRHRLHKRACQHRVSQIIQEMIAEAFLKADGHIQIEGSGGRMFTLSTANEDMEAYTKLTDNVFEEILKSSCSELKKAREILQNIISRKSYKFVDERKPKDPIEDWKSRITGWKKLLAQPLPDEEENNLKPEDFEILVIEMDYGMDDKDPIQHVHFYSKSELDVANCCPSLQGSRIRTTCFSEQLIRVFCNKIDDKSVEAAKKHFKQWVIRAIFLQLTPRKVPNNMNNTELLLFIVCLSLSYS
uniref:HD domain-containing protein n=1 Tax=Labrus bergylta TaxID=56723 RepID=A0A3Q3GN73_9LABR